MSEQRFEISFSGQLIEGADLQTVKQHIGMMFKADSSRLEQLFSGRRVIIKREADEATIAKYRAAFHKAGAICEIRPVDASEPVTKVEPQPTAAGEDQPYTSRYPESDLVPQALLSTLGISAAAIPDLEAEIAPVGSPMQYQIKTQPEPSIDIGEFELAPVGSILSTATEQDPPPIPDTSGLSLAELS